MSGLVLKLRPREQLMINGVIVENGDRNTRLHIKSEGANILRLKHAIDAADATTPIKRAYYLAQQAVAGAVDAAQAKPLIGAALAMHFNGAGDTGEARAISRLIDQNEIYQAMRLIGKIAFEESYRRTDDPPADSDD